MASANYQLDFERPLYQLEEKIAEMKANDDGTQAAREDRRRLRRELTELRKKIYSELTPWQTVRVARHQERPMTTDYINLAFDEFVELHGDRFFGDDRAMRAGFAKIDRFKVMLIGHQKGKTLEERQQCFFWLCPSGRLSQGIEADEDGSQVWTTGDLSDRHARCLSRGRRGGARSSTGDC